MSDPNGVPFTVAPVRSDDPAKKKKEEDEGQKGEANGVDEAAKGSARADGKDKEKEEEELVGGTMH